MTNKEIKLSISIDDLLLRKFTEIGQKHYPNEFGGFLIGYYSDDSTHLNITDTVLPIQYKSTKYQFERSTNGIIEKLKCYYEETPRKYYVGEWHTHPDNLATPSNKDKNAIDSILRNQEALIQNPLLLIIGYNKLNVEFGFYIYFKNKLYKYD